MKERRTLAGRPTRRGSWALRLLALGAILVVFILGIAIGQALDDGPPSPATETYIRTLTTPNVESGTSTRP
ncbi:hypothetical protein [Gaiella sp.]|uniref:hypothetical protein n=1 Tax=Gaiella sp. TaxID=2663207 RepID=UPI00326355E6